MNKVDEKTAQADVDKWLAHRRIKPSKRESNKSGIEAMVAAMMDGDLILDPETFDLKHKLAFPITTGDKPINDISYKPRLLVRDVHSKLKGVKPDDADGRVLAYVSALTDQPKNVISGFDMNDYSLSTQIAIFFI